ncbi:MAG: hypothetical protein EBV06_12065 [Planctomycetia bacterium]|nr:hypothetical protein [Planctomycetia bacterium]
MFTQAIRWGVVLSVLLVEVANAQCQKATRGPTGSSRPRGLIGEPPRMPGLMAHLPQGNPGVNAMLPQNNPGLNAQLQPGPFLMAMPQGPRLLLATSLDQQRALQDTIADLEELADDPRLSEAQRRRIRSALTVANRKWANQDNQLTLLATRQEKGMLNEADRAKVMTVLQQQDALLQSLQAYRQGAAVAVNRPKLEANRRN